MSLVPNQLAKSDKSGDGVGPEAPTCRNIKHEAKQLVVT